ncbi:hypothetical protein LWI29_028449 [Acer saccharum]|uniref:Reverse transcriptase domain-containing protein n=1 Tax=Acer saccharum TaxID=4024 RepID=A0AA39VUH0_ACESA|nr:hypothetical protein LWI29_028449 [Acer saccharum]
MALKLDMSKAYDRVEWSFLAGMMRCLGFSAGWINRIMKCVTSVSFSFLVNGAVCGDLKPSRGLRQGDPLSPYLFLVCAEGLSRLIYSAVEKGDMAGFRCSRSGPKLSHLFFADDSLMFSKASDKDCQTIKRVLGFYAKASGQENKRQLFASIRDRIWGKIKGWQSKLFSAGGKEVLLKAVVQAIPAYSMSLFRLPKGLVHDIHRLCTRFWWGSSDDARKTHWGSWQKLCQPKDSGGLGFRDLFIFNQALLAKQCWRLICQPQSLAARVLKHCYFPETSVLQASCGNSCSFLWRSFMWGKELLEAGLRWRIGTGNSVFIYKDCWLPRPSTFKPFSPPRLGQTAKVHELMLPSGGWNVGLIREIFWPEDANLILSLPCSVGSQPDSLMWHYDKYGAYSVKSGYRLGCELSSNASSSGLSSKESWWKFFWRIRIPTKVKIFIWRACLNWIPTRCNLAKRGMHLEIICPMCNKVPETTLHALWTCPTLLHIRATCSFLKGFCVTDAMQFMDVMLLCMNNLLTAEFETFCLIFWRVWFRRNRLIHDNQLLDITEVVPWASSFHAEFKGANVAGKVLNPSQPRQVWKWNPPAAGLFKLNTDAAVNSGDGIIGVGVIFRDNDCLVLASSAQRVIATFTPQVAEAVALFRGLRMAKDIGLWPCEIETDAQVLVNLLTSDVIPSSEVGLVIQDIKQILVEFPDCKVAFVPRGANMAAHGLAKLGLSVSCDRFWMEDFPPKICSTVLGEYQNHL